MKANRNLPETDARLALDALRKGDLASVETILDRLIRQSDAPLARKSRRQSRDPAHDPMLGQRK